MITIFFRLIIIYIILVGGMRLVGKRQIGELEISELITTILLSELAAMPITHSNVPLIYALVPILMLISFEVIISFLATKCNFMKRIIYCRPSVLIRKGKLDQKELSKIRLSMEEFLSELRLKNISDISKVDYAILEQNGQLSVFPKVSDKNVTISDLNINADDSGVAHSVIIDGEIDHESLRIANRSSEWLQSSLEKKDIPLDDIFIYTVDDSGNEYIIKKQKRKK